MSALYACKNRLAEGRRSVPLWTQGERNWSW